MKIWTQNRINGITGLGIIRMLPENSRQPLINTKTSE